MKSYAIAFVSILVFVLGSCELNAQTQNSPNIVMFYIDDMGWKDLGCMGSKFYETPNIDRLASQGMLFDNAYSCAPNCAPSRACLMTGLYGPRHGIYTVGSSSRGRSAFRKLIPIQNRTRLADRFRTIPESFKQKGYVSAHFGKWHLGADPKSQGFDVNVAGNRSGSPRGGYFSPYRNPQLSDGPKGEYLTDRLTDEAIKFLESHRQKPFFLYFAHYAVHTPIQSKKELRKKYQQKNPSQGQNNASYAAMIESVDQSVGRILRKLKELKIEQNTVVIFYSDNGGHGPVTSMQPLRGSKGMLYEGGIRVPFFVKWPGKVKAGSRNSTPIIGVDLYPTLMEIAGISTENETLDGRSIVPLLKGNAEWKERSLYWHFPAYLQANRGMRALWRTTPAAAIRRGNFKLLEFFEDGRLELYDLAKDIGERNNLARKLPEKTRELHEQMISWREKVDAPVPTKRNPKYDPTAKRKVRKRRKKKRKKSTAKYQESLSKIPLHDMFWYNAMP